MMNDRVSQAVRRELLDIIGAVGNIRDADESWRDAAHGNVVAGTRVQVRVQVCSLQFLIRGF